MAGRKLNIQGKARASTILEVLISMVIIMLVFGLGMMIFGNVTRSSLSLKRIKAEAILQERLLSAEQNVINLDETISVGHFQLVQEIKPYDDNKHLSVIHLAVFDSNHQKVAELQKTIVIP